MPCKSWNFARCEHLRGSSTWRIQVLERTRRGLYGTVLQILVSLKEGAVIGKSVLLLPGGGFQKHLCCISIVSLPSFNSLLRHLLRSQSFTVKARYTISMRANCRFDFPNLLFL